MHPNITAIEHNHLNWKEVTTLSVLEVFPGFDGTCPLSYLMQCEHMQLLLEQKFIVRRLFGTLWKTNERGSHTRRSCMKRIQFDFDVVFLKGESKYILMSTFNENPFNCEHSNLRCRSANYFSNDQYFENLLPDDRLMWLATALKQCLDIHPCMHTHTYNSPSNNTQKVVWSSRNQRGLLAYHPQGKLGGKGTICQKMSQKMNIKQVGWTNGHTEIDDGENRH